MRCTQWPTSAVGSGNVLRPQSAIDRLPGRAAVIGAKRTRSGDCDEDAIRIGRIEQDRVQAHAAGAGLPLRSGAVAAQAGKFVPCLAAVGGAKHCGVFDAGIDRVRIVKRRFEVPDAFELPRMLACRRTTGAW